MMGVELLGGVGGARLIIVIIVGAGSGVGGAVRGGAGAKFWGSGRP